VSAELRRAKRELRARALALRDALPPREAAAAGRAIADRLLGLPELGAAGTVLVFSSFGSEVPTAVIVERLLGMGRRVAMPRVAGGRIEARTYEAGDPLERAAYGALEPVGGRALRPEELDVVVVPGLAFDRRGYRVGYGGGFFDRFLPRTRPDAFRVGICFHLQLVEEVPHGPGDVPVDAVVTEREVIRCGRPGIGRRA
jgi:5-formyltetrahydrofolate cyclo-ligase